MECRVCPLPCNTHTPVDALYEVDERQGFCPGGTFLNEMSLLIARCWLILSMRLLLVVTKAIIPKCSDVRGHAPPLSKIGAAASNDDNQIKEYQAGGRRENVPQNLAMCDSGCTGSGDLGRERRGARPTHRQTRKHGSRWQDHQLHHQRRRRCEQHALAKRPLGDQSGLREFSVPG